MEDEFPSNVELNVAASLLHLSRHLHLHLHPHHTNSTTGNHDSPKKSHDDVVSLNTTTTTPSRSDLTHIFHLQVARRARSKVIYISSSDRKAAPSTSEKLPVVVKQKAMRCSDELTSGTAEGSCLTTGGTSEVSSGRKRRSAGVAVEKKTNRRRIGSTHIRKRAEAILRMLSGGGCASEVRIRQVLGDSPDTSKALRMLLKMEVVTRSGAGGRADPYKYMVSPNLPLSHIEISCGGWYQTSNKLTAATALRKHRKAYPTFCKVRQGRVEPFLDRRL